MIVKIPNFTAQLDSFRKLHNHCFRQGFPRGKQCLKIHWNAQNRRISNEFSGTKMFMLLQLVSKIISSSIARRMQKSGFPKILKVKNEKSQNSQFLDTYKSTHKWTWKWSEFISIKKHFLRVGFDKAIIFLWTFFREKGMNKFVYLNSDLISKQIINGPSF